jgi:hypothetical protein
MFVDGRAASAYPDELLRDYFRLVELEIDETACDVVLQKFRIDAVLWVKVSVYVKPWRSHARVPPGSHPSAS